MCLVTSTDIEHQRWHCLRRGGVRQPWAAGARNQIIMLARGGESPSVARGYMQPKHAWRFMERGATSTSVWRRWIPSFFRRLIVENVVGGLVAKGDPRTGG